MLRGLTLRGRDLFKLGLYDIYRRTIHWIFWKLTESIFLGFLSVTYSSEPLYDYQRLNVSIQVYKSKKKKFGGIEETHFNMEVKL